MNLPDKEDQIDAVVKLSFFTGIGKAITNARTIRETLEIVMEQVVKVFNPSNWSLLLRNPKTGELTFSVVVGPEADTLKGVSIPRGKGIAGWIAENGQSLIVEDVSKDSRFSSDMDDMTLFQTKSIIGVPLKNNNKVFGVIELINKLDGHPFTPLELNLLATIGDFAAIAIEKAYYMKAMKRMATIDQLTGLYNRRAFISYYEKEYDRSKRSGHNFSIMMIDLDGFKKINDQYGHGEGDKALIRVAGLLNKNLRTADFSCRFGGDEFAILMPETDKEKADHLKERIYQQLRKNNQEHEIQISLSIGIHESNGEDPSSILHYADTAMYREKKRKLESSIDDLTENLLDMVDQD